MLSLLSCCSGRHYDADVIHPVPIKHRKNLSDIDGRTIVPTPTFATQTLSTLSPSGREPVPGPSKSHPKGEHYQSQVSLGATSSSSNDKNSSSARSRAEFISQNMATLYPHAAAPAARSTHTAAPETDRRRQQEREKERFLAKKVEALEKEVEALRRERERELYRERAEGLTHVHKAYVVNGPPASVFSGITEDR